MTHNHNQRVQGLFSHIAGVYDGLNRVFSLGIDALWRKYLSEDIRPALPQGKGIVLDLAAGTMEVTKELHKRYPEAQLLAIDFCEPMLLRGKKKLQHLIDAGLLAPAIGDAVCLPLADESVHAVTVAFGVRNFKPREKALAEIARVLKPGGLLCILEFGSAQDKILFGLYNWYLAKVLPLIGRLISKDTDAYQYLADTIKEFPSADELANECKQAGFSRVWYTRHTAGIVCIHCCEKA